MRTRTEIYLNNITRIEVGAVRSIGDDQMRGDSRAFHFYDGDNVVVVRMHGPCGKLALPSETTDDTDS